MFNGIIKNTGKISQIFKKKNSCLVEINSKLKFSKKDIGSSISCSGACLTLKSFKTNLCTFYMSRETLNRTIFKKLLKNDIINLEKSFKSNDRISGHFVQGHIDTVSRITKIYLIGKSWYVNFSLNKKYKKYLVEKGSIAVNGVSLTIAKIYKNGFQVAVIPKTLKLTNLIYLKKKDLVNVEFDVLGKYIKSFTK